MTQPPSQPAGYPAAKSAPLMHLGHPDGDHIPFFQLPKTPSPMVRLPMLIMLVVVGIAVAFLGHQFEHMGEHAVAPDVHLAWIIPFGLLLASIAIMPFVASHFWHHYYPHVAIGLGLIVIVYYLFFLKAPAAMARSMGEYISFIYMLGALYVISGGILVRVRRKATPTVNTGLLLTGAIIANIFGTTGAAMLLIRPYLRINKGHIRPYHIVFFIFVVANVGGSLTPIGDPPLFLGFLKGIPFWWVLEHCWPMWFVVVGALLAVFFVMDTLGHRREPREAHDPNDAGPSVSIFGVSNLLLIVAVLAAVLLHGQLVHIVPLPWREIVMVIAVGLSLWSTPHRIHVENVFNFAPIKEVAFLFIGIFATMVPALNYLAVHAQDKEISEALNTPGQFYFATGTLSAVLDNAPTYMTFLEAEMGKLDKSHTEFVTRVVKDPAKSRPTDEDYREFFATQAEKYPSEKEQAAFKQEIEEVISEGLVKYHGDAVKAGKVTNDQVRLAFLLGKEDLNWYVIAISLGAVFFGAMTYIGNGPNFMVKSIAETAGVKCPSFFGYIGMYSLPILLPVLILIWALFLSRHAGH